MTNRQVKKFATAYDPLMTAFILAVAAGLWAPVVIYGETEIIVFVINGVISILLLSIVFGTYYFVADSYLYYRCGPFRGKIDIHKIRKIENDDSITKTSFMKLGMSHKGYKIFYDKFNDIYLSPKNKEEFLTLLLDINPEIAVIR